MRLPQSFGSLRTMPKSNNDLSAGTHSIIGQVIRSLRSARGIGVNQLGNAIGLEPANLSRFERGVPGGVHATKYLDIIASKLDTTASILYAIVDVANENPEILEQPEKLSSLVDQLTLLINNYLKLPLPVKEEIDQLIKDNI